MADVHVSVSVSVSVMSEAELVDLLAVHLAEHVMVAPRPLAADVVARLRAAGRLVCAEDVA